MVPRPTSSLGHSKSSDSSSSSDLPPRPATSQSFLPGSYFPEQLHVIRGNKKPVLQEMGRNWNARNPKWQHNTPPNASKESVNRVSPTSPTQSTAHVKRMLPSKPVKAVRKPTGSMIPRRHTPQMPANGERAVSRTPLKRMTGRTSYSTNIQASENGAVRSESPTPFEDDHIVPSGNVILLQSTGY